MMSRGVNLSIEAHGNSQACIEPAGSSAGLSFCLWPQRPPTFWQLHPAGRRASRPATSHLRVAGTLTPEMIVSLILGVTVWGLWFRDPRIRALIPRRHNVVHSAALA